MPRKLGTYQLGLAIVAPSMKAALQATAANVPPKSLSPSSAPVSLAWTHRVDSWPVRALTEPNAFGCGGSHRTEGFANRMAVSRAK